MRTLRDVLAAAGLLAVTALGLLVVLLLGYVYGAADGQLPDAVRATALSLLVPAIGVAAGVILLAGAVLRSGGDPRGYAGP
ncbi:MAG: hypothetical protein K2X87_14435 [Gemmataceae bacterium]|nr:hypothetical protein [Gemmataceae bacterium]